MNEYEQENMNIEGEPHIPGNFDEANEAAYNLLNAENVPQEAAPAPMPPMPEEAPPVQPELQSPAAPAPQQMPPPEILLQQAFAELQAVKEENARLQQAMQQQNEIAQQNIVEEALQPPILNHEALLYSDEESDKAKAAYAADMEKFVRASMMKELSPLMEYAKEGMEQKQKGEVISSLSGIPDLQDISNIIPQLDNIISNNKLFASADMPLDEKYIAAYFLKQGIDAKRNPPAAAPQMNDDMFMQYYATHPDLKDIIDKQRVTELKGGQNVPLMSPSGGAVNAALSMPKTPTNFDEAFALSQKYLA